MRRLIFVIILLFVAVGVILANSMLESSDFNSAFMFIGFVALTLFTALLMKDSRLEKNRRKRI